MKITRLTKYSKEVSRQIASLYGQLTLSGRVLKEADIRAFITDDHKDLFVVVDGKRICGMATLVHTRTLRGLSGRVEDVIVDEAYRGQGLGKKVMLALIEHAKKKKFTSLELNSRPVRVAAQKLYESLGFEKNETDPFKLKLR